MRQQDAQTLATSLPDRCYSPWTDEQDQLLKSLASSGMTRKQIAPVLDRTPMGIQGRCQTLGIKIRLDTYGGDSPRHYDLPYVGKRDEQEARDRRFIRALAEAIYRGDHLPGASNAPAA